MSAARGHRSRIGIALPPGGAPPTIGSRTPRPLVFRAVNDNARPNGWPLGVAMVALAATILTLGLLLIG